MPCTSAYPKLSRQLKRSRGGCFVRPCGRNSAGVCADSNRGGAAPNKPSAQDDSYRYYESASCRYPFDQLVIRPDGKVSLCGNDAYGQVTLGDTSRQSLLEIWHGDDYRRLRAELATNGRKNLPVCNRCDVHTFDPDVFLERSRLLRFLNRALGLSSPNWK